MPTAFDELTGQEVDTSSEAWRHRCECAWLLENKPTRTDKHLYLFGVRDRESLFAWNSRAHAVTLREDWRDLLVEKRPIAVVRGFEAADRILTDAKRLHEHREGRAA